MMEASLQKKKAPMAYTNGAFKMIMKKDTF
jgi:hypothetical protein